MSQSTVNIPMRFLEIIREDGDAAGTTAANIATVTFPLFTRGRTRRQKFAAGRRAVGMQPQASKSHVGQGVYENQNEAHVVDNDNVIYRLDRDNPMDDTEVLVLGGAGRYSLSSLRDKARREAKALAKDLETEHGNAFRRSSENIRQLTNTLNTIVAAYNQLERIRQRGGRGSRGIRREHIEVVKEGIAVLELYEASCRSMRTKSKKTGK